jgi:hypothetical protein
MDRQGGRKPLRSFYQACGQGASGLPDQSPILSETAGARGEISNFPNGLIA